MPDLETTDTGCAELFRNLIIRKERIGGNDTLELSKDFRRASDSLIGDLSAKFITILKLAA